jgi:hypothetical protein
MFKKNEKKSSKLRLKSVTIVHLTKAQLTQIIGGSGSTTSEGGSDCQPE